MVIVLLWEALTEAFAARKGGDRDYKQGVGLNASGGRSSPVTISSAATFSNCGNTLKSENTAAAWTTSCAAAWVAPLWMVKTFLNKYPFAKD